MLKNSEYGSYLEKINAGQYIDPVLSKYTRILSVTYIININDNNIVRISNWIQFTVKQDFFYSLAIAKGDSTSDWRDIEGIFDLKLIIHVLV